MARLITLAFRRFLKRAIALKRLAAQLAETVLSPQLIDLACSSGMGVYLAFTR